MSASSTVIRPLKRLLTFPLLLLAAILLLFEELAWDQLEAALRWLARFRLMARLEAWIAALPPWGIFLLFAVPAAALLPVKILALWLLGSGHTLAGIGVLLTAKVAGTAIAARLFTIGREKLLTIALFARGYAFVQRLHEQVHQFVDSIPGWLALRAAIRSAVGRVRGALGGLRRWGRVRRGWLALRFAAARTWVARRWASRPDG